MYPRLVHLYGPLWIYSYGTIIALGCLIFLYLTYRHPARQKLLSGELYLNTIFVGIMSGVIGGRALFIAYEWELYKNNLLDIFAVWSGGFVILGSVLGVIMCVPLYLKYYRVPVLPVLDLAACYAPLLQAVARIGCLMAGCCYGTPAHNIPWAIVFTHPDGQAPLHTPLHPTPLYFSFVYIILFIIFYILFNKIKIKTGKLLFLYLISENGIRFILDYWRGDRGELTTFLNNITLSQPQYMALLFLCLSCVGFIIVSTKKNVSL